MTVKPPTAFVSYSWDDPEHQAWVRDLAERLVTNGVDVRLDQWHVGPGDSLTQFMEEQIANCEHVLVICTPNYAQRSQARAGGVGYEQQIISGHIAAGVPRRKFIPVVRVGGLKPGKDSAIPAHFSGIYAVDLRTPEKEDEGFEQLLRAIFQQPLRVRPDLGAPPSFGATDDDGALDGSNLRLASWEADGWHLMSGVVRNELSPDTFEIPSEGERRGIVPGDLVKLIFEFAIEEDDGGVLPSGERMWVEVTGRRGPYLVGELRNQPASFTYTDGTNYEVDEHAPLAFGSEVVFLPEHVISITGAEEAEEERRALEQAEGRKTKKGRSESRRSKETNP